VTVEFRRLREGEAARIRELRLRALRDAPAAFAASVEQGRTERWSDKTGIGATAETQLAVVAADGERWLGMVVGRLLTDSPASAWLEALWVDPAVRRSGLGSGLIEAVATWSRDRGAQTLELSVTARNGPARALYAHTGFSETGRRRPLPSDPSRTEVFLIRSLRPQE
jgi:ribosomal protein S18 acetylase RimI-like enzyme